MLPTCMLWSEYPGNNRHSILLETLDAKAAPKGAALWLEVIQGQGRAHDPSPPFSPAS